MLSQEDPTEAFFKAIPTVGKGNQIEISYPVLTHPAPAAQLLHQRHSFLHHAITCHGMQDSFSEAYVRRHLLFTARNRVTYHQNWQRVTIAALIPVAPLAISPFPNLPIYYIGWRVFSHGRARAGAAAVLEYLEHLETYKPSAPEPETQAAGSKALSSLHNSFDYSVTAHVLFRPCSDLSEVAASRDRCPSLLSPQLCIPRLLCLLQLGSWPQDLPTAAAAVAFKGCASPWRPVPTTAARAGMTQRCQTRSPTRWRTTTTTTT